MTTGKGGWRGSSSWGAEARLYVLITREGSLGVLGALPCTLDDIYHVFNDIQWARRRKSRCSALGLAATSSRG